MLGTNEKLEGELKSIKTLDQVSRIWFNGSDGSHEYYLDSRYHCFNLPARI